MENLETYCRYIGELVFLPGTPLWRTDSRTVYRLTWRQRGSWPGQVRSRPSGPVSPVRHNGWRRGGRSFGASLSAEAQWAVGHQVARSPSPRSHSTRPPHSAQHANWRRPADQAAIGAEGWSSASISQSQAALIPTPPTAIVTGPGISLGIC